MLISEESGRDKEVENDKIGNTVYLLEDQREETSQHNLDIQKMENNKHKPQVDINEMSTVIAGDGLSSWHDPNYQMNNKENDLPLKADKMELLPEPFLLLSEIKYVHMTPVNQYEQQEMAASNAETEIQIANNNGGLCGMDSTAAEILLLADSRLVADSGLSESSRRGFTEDEVNNELTLDEIEHNIKPISKKKSCDKVLGPDMITPVSLSYVRAKHDEHLHWQDPVDSISDQYFQEEEYPYVTSHMELTNYNQHGKVECTKKLMKKKFSPKHEKESMAESKSNPKKKKTFIRWKLYLRYRLCLKRKRNYKKKKVKYSGNVSSGKKVCSTDDQTDSFLHLEVHLPVQSSEVSSDAHQFDFLNQVRKLKADKSRAATGKAKSSKHMFICDFLKTLTSTWHNFPNILNRLQTVILLPAGLQLCFETLLRMPPAEERERMSYEWLRLLSFVSYPISALGSGIRLAQAGFYYTGNGTLATCYACGVQHSEWSSSDNPREIHRRISPHCPFLGGTPTYANVPIMADREENVITVGNNAPDSIPPHTTTLTMVVNSPTNLIEASKVSSSSTYKLKTLPVSPPEPQAQCSQEKGQNQEAAEQILSQVENPSGIGTPSINPESTVDFVCIPSVIDQPIESGSSAFSARSREFQQEHSAEVTNQNYPQQHSVDVEIAQYVTLGNLSHSVENPELDSSCPRSLECSKYPDFAEITFYTNWPGHLDQTPQQLAEAGIFYTDQGDKVISDNDKSTGVVCCSDVNVTRLDQLTQHYETTAVTTGTTEGSSTESHLHQIAGAISHGQQMLQSRQQIGNNNQLKAQPNSSRETTKQRIGFACNADSLSKQPAIQSDQLEAIMKHFIELQTADNENMARTLRKNDASIKKLHQKIKRLSQNCSSQLMPSPETTTHARQTSHHASQIAGGRSHRHKAGGRSHRHKAGGGSHRQNAGERSHRQQTSQSRRYSRTTCQVSDQTTLNPTRAPNCQNMSDHISIPPSFVPLGNKESHQSNMLPAANSQQSSQQQGVEHLPNKDTPSVRDQCCHQSGEQSRCKICMERMVELAFVPCGHAVTCRECGTALQLCPICRVKIQSSLRIFM